MSLESQPLVSVIMPAYNAERFICDSIDSILAQTYQNFEAIIVDDGSTDGTLNLMLDYEKRDPRIRVYSQANQGACAARNFAISESSGAFIAPLDADDIWLPEKLEKQIDCMLRAGETCGIVYGWSMYIDEMGAPTGGYSLNIEEGDVYLKLLCINFLSNGSVPLIRRTALMRCGVYRDEYFSIEDRELFIRIAKQYKFKVVRDVVVLYRVVRNSVSHNYKKLECLNENLLNEILNNDPDVPNFIFRWSRGISYAYFASRSIKSHNYIGFLKYLARAIWNDPGVLLWLARRSRGRLARLRARPHEDHGSVAGRRAPRDAAGSMSELRRLAESVPNVDTFPLRRSRRRRLEMLESGGSLGWRRTR